VILFECLTGRCPFARANLLAVLVAITTEATPRLRDHRPELPAALEAALLRAMDPAPERRWSSARAFGEALLPFATDTGRAQWTGFFAAPATDPAELGRQSTLPPTVAPAAVARQETLAPATRSSLDPARRTTRLRAGAAGLVALVAALAAGAALARRPGAPAPSPAPVALRRPPPAAAPPPVTAIASPDAGAPVAAAPAPAPVVAPVIAPAALVAGEPAARRHHRHRRAPGAEAFPNF
jgi:serine/threonine-protein kinase